ncbi:hypothetical protein HOK021_69210 [Streptomyces hygroscopicus]|nr:hypothetical protein HOK021_69210 [Streptomyces hygroscopicus]
MDLAGAATRLRSGHVPGSEASWSSPQPATSATASRSSTAGRTAKAVGDTGGFKNAFGKVKLDGLGNFKNPLRDFEISLPRGFGTRHDGGTAAPSPCPGLRDGDEAERLRGSDRVGGGPNAALMHRP